MRRLNEPAETALRANRLKTTPEELAAAIGGTVAGPEGRDAVVLDGPFDAHGHELWHEGHYMPSRARRRRVAPFLAPAARRARARPLRRARRQEHAPRGADAAARARSSASSSDADRAEQLRTTAARMGATIVDVQVGDAADVRTDGPFDRVLADPPCSGLGTLQARPGPALADDARRGSRGLVDEQRAILARRRWRRSVRAAWWCGRPARSTLPRTRSCCATCPGSNCDDAVTLFPHETGSAGFAAAAA